MCRYPRLISVVRAITKKPRPGARAALPRRALSDRGPGSGSEQDRKRTRRSPRPARSMLAMVFSTGRRQESNTTSHYHCTGPIQKRVCRPANGRQYPETARDNAPWAASCPINRQHRQVGRHSANIKAICAPQREQRRQRVGNQQHDRLAAREKRPANLAPLFEIVCRQTTAVPNRSE